MNPLVYLLRRFRSRERSKVELDLSSRELARFQSWERGFDAYSQGVPLEECPKNGRATPLWKSGWFAAKRVDELMEEQATTTAEL